MARQHSYTGPALTGGQNATIIGPFPVESAQKVVGYVWADQAGSVFIEHSADGTNWDVQEATITLVANTGAKIDVDPLASYIRIRVVNGGVAQGAIRAYVRTLNTQGR